MHKIKVYVVQAQAFQARVEGFLDTRMVCAWLKSVYTVHTAIRPVRTPEFCCHEYVFSLDARFECFSQAFTNLILVAIYISSINVLVTNRECVCHGLLDFPLRALPCSQACSLSIIGSKQSTHNPYLMPESLRPCSTKRLSLPSW